MRISSARLAGLFIAIIAGSSALISSPAGAAASPPSASAAPQVVSVATGYSHTCALIKDGTVRCWGDNDLGQLGYGDTSSRGNTTGAMGDNLPAVNLGTGRKAKAIAAGADHTCAILDNNTIKCWGMNEWGQLGYGDTNNRGDTTGEMGDNLPAVNLGTGRKAKAISAGADHTCAILDNKTVKCWGRSNSGQLGYGDATSRGNAPDEMGDNLPTVNLGTRRKAKAITAGDSHTCVVLDNNTAKCWGANGSGQLGYGDTNNRGDTAGEMGDNLPTVQLGTRRKAKALAAGIFHTCAILDNKTVKCWGLNDEGELGYGDTNGRGEAAGEMGDNLPTVNLGSGRKVRVINVHDFHSCAILDNKTVKCWGGNWYGELGYGDAASRGDGAGEMGDDLLTADLGTGRTAQSVATGANHTCAVLDNNTVKCWGINDSGQLGYGDTDNRGDTAGEMGDNLPAVNLGVRVRAIAAGEAHTCVLLEDGTVKCWGHNDSGQLGYGDTNNRGDAAGAMGDNLPAVNLGTGRKAKAITAGYQHTCALLDDNTVKCWGYNNDGELGYGDTANRGDAAGEMGDNLLAVDLGTGRKAKAITAGSAYTCAILDNNTVKCWGYNGEGGPLGYGDTNNRGDAADEMGNNLPAVNLGTRRKAKAIAAGFLHTCAILDNNTVKCWGENSYGQLGYGDTTFRGDGAGEMGDNLPAVDLGNRRKAKAITTGNGQTCALLDNNTVKCWGWNTLGQLGYGDHSYRGDGAGEMGDNLPVVDLGTRRKAKAISAGAFHTCAFLDNNTVKCWGWNGYGQLGYGDTDNRGDGIGAMGDNLPAVDFGTQRTARAIAAGRGQTCAILDNNTVKCWGANDYGQLGYGDTTFRGDGPGEMGDYLRQVVLTG